MTGALRTEIRAAVRTALALAHPSYAEFPVWTQATDTASLPGWGCGIAASRYGRIDNSGTTETTLTLTVIVKRVAPYEEIEDLLDLDQDAFAPVVLASLPQTPTRRIDGELTDVAMRVDRSGELPVGVMALQFQITAWP